MKTEIINNGTTEFPFYTIMVDSEEYCSTGDIKKAENIVNLLSMPIVSKCLPTDKEIFEEAQKVERFKPFDSDVLQAESAGRFHGFKKGAKFIMDKLNVC